MVAGTQRVSKISVSVRVAPRGAASRHPTPARKHKKNAQTHAAGINCPVVSEWGGSGVGIGLRRRGVPAGVRRGGSRVGTKSGGTADRTAGAGLPQFETRGNGNGFNALQIPSGSAFLLKCAPITDPGAFPRSAKKTHQQTEPPPLFFVKKNDSLPDLHKRDSPPRGAVGNKRVRI